MHVREYMSLITATVYVKLVKVAHKSVISPRLGGILRFKIDPLLLYGLELCQVVKVNAPFTGIPSEEKYTVLEGQAMSA